MVPRSLLLPCETWLPKRGKRTSPGYGMLQRSFPRLPTHHAKDTVLYSTGQVWQLKESMSSSWVSGCGKIVLIGDDAYGTLPWVR